MTTVGLDELCPCGSGQTYRQCCFAAEDEDERRRRMRQAAREARIEIAERDEPVAGTDALDRAFGLDDDAWVVDESSERDDDVADWPPPIAARFLDAVWRLEEAVESAAASQADGSGEDDDAISALDEVSLAAVPSPVIPYAIARLMTDPVFLERAGPELRDQATRLWSPGRLAAMETDAILARLEEVGVEVDRERFRRDAEGETSAWAVSDRWVEALDDDLDNEDDDFVGLAACELWHRFDLHRPSAESLLDRIDDGYTLLSGEDLDGACVVWLETWLELSADLPATVRDFASADRRYGLLGGLEEWLRDDLVDALHDLAVGHGRCVEEARSVAQQLIGRFVEEPAGGLVELHCALADLQILAGEMDTGRASYEAIIAQAPDLAYPYQRYASAVLDLAGAARRADLEHVVAALREAIARPVRDLGGSSISADMDELLAELGERVSATTDNGDR